MGTDLSRLVANATAECMTNREISYEETIVWSVGELYAAAAAGRAHRASIENGGTRGSADTPDANESLRVLEEWFYERYRSHATNVAKVHFIRYLKICHFMYVHRDELERQGWAMGGCGDGHLLRALVTIRCPPDLDPSPAGELGTPIDLADAFLLRAALQKEALEVTEFERVPWEPEPDGGEADGSADERRLLDPGRLLAALVMLEELAVLPPGERARCESRFRRELSQRARRELAEETGQRFVLLAWLIESVGQDPRAARRTVDRTLAIDRFLEAYGPHLVDDGLAIWGRRIRWKPILIEALACADPSSWRSRSEFPFEQYQSIVAAARALEVSRAGV